MFNIFNNDSNKGQRLSSSSISLDDSKVKSNNDDIMIQGLVELKGTISHIITIIITIIIIIIRHHA